jgi:O-antigen/teichoic acid export membrane protein
VTMSAGNRRIVDNTMILYSRTLVTMVIGFFTARIVLEELGAEDYGMYFVVGGIVGMFSLLNGSMSGATQRWITFALGKNDRALLNKVFAIGMTAQLGVLCIAVIICESIGLWYLDSYAVFPLERSDAVRWVFHISVATVALQMLSVPFIGVISAHERMSALAYISIADAVLRLIICFVLPRVIGDKLIVYAGLLFLGQVLQFFLFQVFSRLNFEEARFRFGWDKSLFKDMWRLAFWSLSGNLAFISYTQGLTMLINLFFGPATNAAAGIAGQAANMVNQFRVNFQQAMNPQITKTFAQKQYSAMENLVIRSSKFSQYLVLIFAVPLFLEARFLLDFWLTDVPDHTVAFLRIGLLVSMAMTIRAPLVTSAMASGELKKYQLVVISILTTICPVSYVLLSFGAKPEVTSIVLFLTLLIATVASAYMLQGMTKLNFRRFMTEAMGTAIVITALSFILPGAVNWSLDEGWFRVCLVSAVATCSTSILIYFGGLRGNEKRVIRESFEHRFRRLLS